MPLTKQQFTELRKQGLSVSQIVKFEKGDKPQKDIGIVQSLAQGVVSPYGKIASTAASIIKEIPRSLKIGAGVADIGIKRLLGRDVEQEKKKLTQLGTKQPEAVKVGLGYLGDYTPIESTKEAIGTGLEIGADIAIGGGVKKLGQQTLKGAIKKGALGGLKSGVTGGALTGAGLSLQEGGDIGDVAKGTLIGAAFGGLLGTVIGGLSPAVSKGIRKTIDALNPEKAVNKLSELNANILKMTGKQQGIEAKWQKNTPKFLAQEGVPLKGKAGKLDTSEAVDMLSKKYTVENDSFKSLLKSENKYISLDQYKQKALKDIDTPFNRSKGSDFVKMQKHITDEVDTLTNLYQGQAIKNLDGEMLVPLDVFNEIKAGRWASSKGWATADDKIYSNTNFQMGHTAKEIIEDSIDDFAVKNMNKRLGDFASALNVLEKKNGITLGGGKLGRWFGTLVGMKVLDASPASRILGAITGERLAEALQDPAIKTAFARKLIQRARKEGGESIVKEAEEILRKRGVASARIKLLTAPTDIFASAVGTSGKSRLLSQEQAIKRLRESGTIKNEGTKSIRKLSK